MELQPNSEYRLNGAMRRYTSVGSYPVFYVLDDECLCADCADECIEPLERAAVNWESDLNCMWCGATIEAAYQ